MSNATKKLKSKPMADLILKQIWRIKDTLSASYNHDVDQLFAEARQRQKESGHAVVNLQRKKSSLPEG